MNKIKVVLGAEVWCKHKMSLTPAPYLKKLSNYKNYIQILGNTFFRLSYGLVEAKKSIYSGLAAFKKQWKGSTQKADPKR